MTYPNEESKKSDPNAELSLPERSSVSYGFLEECDGCHDEFSLLEIRLDESGKFFYCDKCSS